jgi:nitrogen fixation protein NifU and related proteins
MYSLQVIEHFEHPRNVGEVAAPSAFARVENPACGDLMELGMKVVDERITEIRYRTKGCVTAIACGSALTESLSGCTLDEARAFRREQLVTLLGGLTNESMHASHLAFEALQAALRQLG